MSAKRVAVSTFGCVACQRWLLGAFITGIHPTARAMLVERQCSPEAGLQRRALSLLHPRRVASMSASPGEGLENDIDPSDQGQRLEEENVDRTVSQAPSAPWYLQSQASAVESVNPFAARQRIPQLPPNSPPMLQPLLKHVSIDLGLDYLSIIDLRSLDPPPALGAGLVMVFGSARSEKHLNVSADRLCRWLRSTYKLSPTADGLLGRNELKLKLRRKARRSRMLGAVGSSEPSNPDDGIATGWICVNLGEVEHGSDPNPSGQRSDVEGFVGFGKRTGGARIVVQMMTEDKRNEVDLESLWQGMLEREGRKKEGEKRAWERLEKIADVGQDESNIQTKDASRAERYDSRLSPLTTSYDRVGQVRGYHTSARHQHANDRSDLQHEAGALDEDDLEPHLLPSNQAPFKVPEAILNSVWDEGLESLSFKSKVPSKSFDNFTASLALRTQIDYLKKLNDSVAGKQLGHNQYDRSSTAFLKSFHDAVPAFPELSHWLCRVELQCFALRHAQPGYTRLHLIEMFRDMQASGLRIPEEVFVTGLEAILLSEHELDHKSVLWQEHETKRHHAFRRSLGFAFELVERMEAHGYNVNNGKIFLLLLKATMTPNKTHSSKTSFAMSTDEEQHRLLEYHNVDKLQYKFRRALNLLYTPPAPSDDPLYLALMQACISIGYWDGLWETWRNVARMMQRRGPRMYTLMFSEVASTRHQAQCQRVLMECVPEMGRESPPVLMEEELARAVLECLVVARVDVGSSPWKQIVDDCKDGLGLR